MLPAGWCPDPSHPPLAATSGVHRAHRGRLRIGRGSDRARALTSEVTRCCASCSLDPWIQVPVELAMSRAVVSSRCRAPCSHKPPASGPAGACQVCIALPRTLHSLQLALVSEVCIGSRCHDVTPPLPSPCSCRHAQELRALPLPRCQASSVTKPLRCTVACPA